MDNQCDKCQDAIKLWVRSEYAEPLQRLVRLETKHDESLMALEIQAKEYERRLETLNHAHQKHETFAASFVSEETYTTYSQTVERRFDEITEFMAEVRGSSSGKSSYRHLIFEVITLVIAAVSVSVAMYVVLR